MSLIFFLYFLLFIIFHFSITFLYLFLCEVFLLFLRWIASFWWFFFSFLTRTRCNTWKSYNRQLQILTSNFNKKSFCEYFWHLFLEPFWVLYRKLLSINISKTVCGVVLVLFWFRISCKTTKTLQIFCKIIDFVKNLEMMQKAGGGGMDQVLRASMTQCI